MKGRLKRGSKAKSSLKTSHPRVLSCLVCIGVVVAFWWARIFYKAWTTNEENSRTDFPPSSSITVDKEARCRMKSSNLGELGGDAAVAVVMDPLLDDKLLLIGGTGHWFHIIERVLPYIVQAAKDVWKVGAQIRSKKIMSSSNEEPHIPSKLYLVFQEDTAVSKLDGFCRFMFSLIFSGGYFDEVIIGYSSDIDDVVLRGSGGEGMVRTFHKHSTLTFPNAGQQEDVTYTEIVYHQGWQLRGFRKNFGETRKRFATSETKEMEDNQGLMEVSALCVKSIMRVSWDNAPPKRYFLTGNDTDVYSLLHASVESVCRFEPLVGARTTSTAAKYLGASTSKASDATLISLERTEGLMSGEDHDKIEESDDIALSAFEQGKSPDKVEKERKRQARLPRDDLSRLPQSVARDNVDLNMYSKAEYSMPQEGRIIGGNGDDARDEIFSRKIAKWAAALDDRGAVGKLASNYNYNRDKKVLKAKYANAGEVLKLHDILVEAKSRKGGLAAAPVSVDVPLRVLVYNRDRTRRLKNAHEAAEVLRGKLHLLDEERHDHLPYTYKAGERRPHKRPALRLGSLREEKLAEDKDVEIRAKGGRGSGLGRGRSAYRRKQGGFSRDQSSLRHYEDGHKKISWTVEVMTHNSYHAHNPHASRANNQTTTEKGALSSSNSAEIPPCQLARALREATVLITPHGFQSILMLLQAPKSLLVEIFPYGYNKPEIFGLIQAGMRAFPHGKHRSYLHSESPPTSLIPRLMHTLRLFDDPFINGVSPHSLLREDETRAMLRASLWDLEVHQRKNDTAINRAMQRLRKFEEDTHEGEYSHDRKRWYLFPHSVCTGNALCRYIVKNQDVFLTEPFMRRIVEYAKTHYVSNKEKNAYVPEDVEVT